MQLSLLSCRSFPVLACGLVFVLAANLSACSSKNPLMTEPPTSGDKALAASAPAAEKPAATQATASIAPSAATTPVAPEQATPAPAVLATQSAPAPSGTKRWLGIFSPYKIDIQQGNFISQEMASKLKEGMTKEQVRFLLGAPLLTDMFHDGRWDYLFRLQKGKGELTKNRLTVYFKDNRVIRFESTKLPGEVEYISHISGAPPPPAKETPKAMPEAKPESR